MSTAVYEYKEVAGGVYDLAVYLMLLNVIVEEKSSNVQKCRSPDNVVTFYKLDNVPADWEKQGNKIK